jgi:hypothetical protein
VPLLPFDEVLPAGPLTPGYDAGVPTYLRWIAAITAGITAQFAFFILVGAIAIGTGNAQPGEGVGLLVTLGSFLVSVIPALAVNDWLLKRYPVPNADRRNTVQR